ncbi:MAG: hypothetical protein ACRBB0_10080 [Pelagimonas sp.]|uniref:hypothetical protein n=1 Tax=Pelagimonas sp. TaxID=2073170 RepID=UPI003D6BA6D6
MKSHIKNVLMVLALGLASAAMAPASMAQAKSCGGHGQKACAWHKPGPECGTWLREVRGYCKPCGSKGQKACKIISKGKACKPNLSIKKGICVPTSSTVIGKIGDAVGDTVGGVFGGGKKEKILAESRKHGPEIARIAKHITRALPDGREARALAGAIKDKDGRAIQKILRDNDDLRDSFDALERMGFKTVTVGIESCGAFFAGGAHETGFAMDLDFTGTPQLYTTTSLSGGYHFGGGNDLVFSFYRSGHTRIDGHAFGSIAEFDAGSGVGVNMWFTAKPFDFSGFSLGVGIGSVGGGGALTYALTKIWN